MDLVVGVDAGGTASRAVVATVDGTIVGRGRGGPANPLSVGAGPAGASVGAALKEALGAHPPDAVVAGVFGIAGPASGEAFLPVWHEFGGRGRLTVVGDVVTAFAAGSCAPGGAVLIAGTGAIAAVVRSGSVVRTADGLGWLLGDEGSGRWIGLQAVRAAVRQWSSPFAARVASHAGVGSADEMVRWAQGLPLASIGALAPVVCAAARAGDPQAAAIVERAVAHLVDTLDSLGEPGPVVLGGGLLTADTPVRDGVVATLRRRSVAAVAGPDPAAGAAWLAAREVSRLPPAELHRALTRR